MRRRTFLAQSIAASTLPSVGFSFENKAAEKAIEIAHGEIWNRFIDEYGIMLDFADFNGSVDLPTPEECRLGKPNALGWWTPIENGGFFNGLYLEAMLQRWELTGEKAIAAKACRLTKGLLHLNSISDVKGFVGRGVSTDGKSHYAMGSNDQTFPWIYGLWRFLESDLAKEVEGVREHLVSTIETLAENDWKMPAEEPFQYRGSFKHVSFESAPRLLFVLRMMHRLTGEQAWLDRYRDALVAGEKPNRADYCEEGMRFEKHRYSWTAGNSVVALRALWEMEDDKDVKSRFATGLRNSTNLALESLPLADKYPNDKESAFNFDWKMMNEMWKPQSTQDDARFLAGVQLKEYMKTSPKRGLETSFVREPAFAAWIVTLDPDRSRLKERAGAVRDLIAKFDASTMIYSQFFPMEMAWWRLKAELA